MTDHDTQGTIGQAHHRAAWYCSSQHSGRVCDLAKGHFGAHEGWDGSNRIAWDNPEFRESVRSLIREELAMRTYTPGSSDVPGLSDEAWLAHVGGSERVFPFSGRHVVAVDGKEYAGPTRERAIAAARKYHGSVGTVADVLAAKRKVSAALCGVCRACSAEHPNTSGHIRCSLLAGHAGDHCRYGVNGPATTWANENPPSGTLDLSTLKRDLAAVGAVSPSAPERVDAAVRYLRDLADALDGVVPDDGTGHYVEYRSESRDLRSLADKLAKQTRAVRAVAGVATPP